MGELDLYPGAIAGYRAFRLFAGRLYSLTANHGGTHFEWDLGVNEARCTNRDHRAPDWNCGCGFWAYKDLDGVLSEPIAFPQHDHTTRTQLTGVPIVLTLMAGWGKVVEDELGFRCEYARPIAVIDATAPVPLNPAVFGYPRFYGSYRFEPYDLGLLRSVERESLPSLVEELGLTVLEREEPEAAPMLLASANVREQLRQFRQMMASTLGSAVVRVKELLGRVEDEPRNPSPREIYRVAAAGKGRLSYADYADAMPENRRPWLPGYMRQKGRA